jgi:tRNA U34 5-methylaminomethyl-2-thiouridine-forming methyltransferase MnmC
MNVKTSMSDETDFNLLAHANGTHTLVDAENGQAMHSRIGPEAEAKSVYADRARIEEKLRDDNDTPVLYDVGMGTGANVVAALERLKNLGGARGRLKIFSFETKPKGLRAALDRIENFPLLRPWMAELRALLENGEIEFELGSVQVAWRLLVGDFYRAITEESESAERGLPPPDFIFFDFYSPKVAPELWTRENFARLRKKIGENPATLFTYSAATPVRMNLLLAGFFVGEGVSTGVKNETTIAATSWALLEHPLSPAWLKKLETSTSIANSTYKDEVRRHPQWSDPRDR